MTIEPVPGEGKRRRVRGWKDAAHAGCYNAMMADGVTPERRGLPDFWGYVNGRIIFVEVKPARSSRLRNKQTKFLHRAAQAGALTYRYSPDRGFEPIGHNRPWQQWAEPKPADSSSEVETK